MNLPVAAVLFLFLLLVAFLLTMFLGLLRKGPFDDESEQQVESPYTERGDAKVIELAPRYGKWNPATEEYESVDGGVTSVSHKDAVL